MPTKGGGSSPRGKIGLPSLGRGGGSETYLGKGNPLRLENRPLDVNREKKKKKKMEGSR